MDNDIDDSPGTNKRRQGRGVRARLALVGLVTIALLTAACGSGSKDPGAASADSSSNANTTTTTTVAPSGSSGQSSQSQQLQFAQCMRSHGVTDYPDPSPGGGTLNAISAAGINTQSPTFQAALQACKQYTPEGNLTPAQSAAENAEGLEISQCMRSHGVPNFPDPSTGPVGEQVINLHGLGIDPSSPTFQAANSACEKLYPGAK